MNLMKKSVLAVMALMLTGIALGQEDTTWEPREKLSKISTKGTVTAIDKGTRNITLKGPDGELVTVKAEAEVARFNEIAVGDAIAFDYYTYLKAEFREPTEEEKANPIVAIAEEGVAPDDMAPAGAVGAMVKALVTIEILNRPQMLATVKGPNGNYLTIPMEDSDFMGKLSIGQVVILTYAEAMAVSLEKLAE
ncbi:hypothetical protein [Eudoraea chungangensis]|uniref:hypothetical protein n=1 Tax=Eudoraea chungangensis TaxID=1481905 RepID=UPI0023EA98C3|nr:hypothetical protein [Eudoraea chungangensis]